MKKFSDVGFCALFILFVLVIVIAATIENEGISEDREWLAKEYSDGAIEMGYLRMWDLSEELENRPVKVAVIDTGIDCMNEELTGHIFINPKDFPGNEIDDDGNGYVDDIIGWNFCNNSYSCKACGNNPGNNHGTLVAGIIAANHNSIGINGIAGNKRIQIIPIQVLNEEEQGTVDSLISAIEYAESLDADICNISINFNKYSSLLQERVEHSSMIFVVSAGNNSRVSSDMISDTYFPYYCEFSNVIIVSSIDQNENVSMFAGKNSNAPVIYAPGEKIKSTLVSNCYATVSGTSFAAPIVTGVIAEALSCSKTDVPNTIVREVLFDTATTKNTYDGQEIKIVNGYKFLFELNKYF